MKLAHTKENLFRSVALKKVLSVLILMSSVVYGDEVIRIEVGRNYQNYSQDDLRRRVWELERAVSQLQQKVFNLESKPGSGGDSWICKTTALGEEFSATGGSRAVAKHAVMEKCKASEKSSKGFHCGTPTCEQ